MNTIPFLTTGVTLFLTIPFASIAQNVVLKNAEIYTVNENREWADAVAFNEAGVIIAVGREDEVIAVAGGSSKVIDLEGRMVLPGFQDIHVHAVEAGMNSTLCFFDAFDGLAGLTATLEDCAANVGPEAWVLGANVNMVNLLSLHDNPVEVLDAVVPEQPVLILDDIGHGAWANSLALQMVGYDTAPDQNNGNIILRNAAGTPNGVVLENAPHRLRTASLPPTEDNLNFAFDSLLEAAATLKPQWHHIG